MGTLPFKWLRVVGHNIGGDSHEKDSIFLHYQLRLSMYYSKQRPSGEWKGLCPAIRMASEERVPGRSDNLPADRRGLRVPKTLAAFTN